MRFLSDCPSLEGWKRFLMESLPGTQAANLAQHLDTCSRCQASVERLTRGTPPWLQLANAWRLGSPDLSPASSDNRTDKREKPSALSRLPKQEGPAMIGYTCPRCSTILRVQQDQAGSKHDCPSCGQRLRIPGNKTVLGDLVPKVPCGTQKALVACTACGKQVSRHAPACPHCAPPIAVAQSKPPPATAQAGDSGLWEFLKGFAKLGLKGVLISGIMAAAARGCARPAYELVKTRQTEEQLQQQLKATRQKAVLDKAKDSKSK